MKTASKAIKVLETVTVPTSMDSAEVEKTKKEVSKVYEFADSLEISDHTTLEKAENFTRACSEHEKKVKKTFEKIITKMKEAKKAAADAYAEVNGFVNNLIAPVVEAKRLADSKARAYRDEEQRRIAIENEKRRQEAIKAEEEKRKKEIEELKAAGTKEAKEAARELKKAEIIPTFVEEKELPKVQGVSHRQAWTSERDALTDHEALEKLVKAAAQDFKTYGRFLTANMTALNAEARLMKNRFSVPGYRAVDQGATMHR